MKLIHRNIDKDGKGEVTLMPDDPEDIWHAYNLISEGDSVKGSTIRKVQTETATGSSQSNRIRTTLTVCVVSTDFDTQACVLRLKGRNIAENPYVKMGAYHTLDLEPNRKFTLGKAHWDSVFLERVEMACDPTQNADLAAVVMQEGLAHVCLVTSSMTLVRAKIENTVPRKRKGNAAQHEKGLHRFYENVMQAILRHVNFDVVKCVLVASPGFVRDQFFEFMMQQALKTDNKQLLENKNKFLLLHSSSGFKHSLREVLSDPSVQSKLADTKAAGEVKVLDSFYSLLQNEPARAYYGLKHVEVAHQAQAVETLLITDTLFRSKDLTERKRCVALVDGVREYGGTVKIFSSLHPSGEQLDQLTGVAAILRYPMPEIEEEDHADDSD
ncbi:unnamed protein product [Darwinula stevensoni]|uniref:Protein pelota homolog n=1 Tax=Darwinula stevensoni TaxID=69355 RepID=A0A7R8X4J3_9CRUS|nr:unnamed protein product [Darwinula stevensoni]CAG0885665.1 unnamed protein product [Darwinula stevensoni]